MRRQTDLVRRLQITLKPPQCSAGVIDDHCPCLVTQQPDSQCHATPPASPRPGDVSHSVSRTIMGVGGHGLRGRPAVTEPEQRWAPVITSLLDVVLLPSVDASIYIVPRGNTHPVFKPELDTRCSGSIGTPIPSRLRRCADPLHRASSPRASHPHRPRSELPQRAARAPNPVDAAGCALAAWPSKSSLARCPHVQRQAASATA
jgi:hypothetical protein